MAFLSRSVAFLKGIIPRLKWRYINPLRQSHSNDCGPTCLAMILNYHQASVSPRLVQDCFRPGRSGVSARELLRVALAFDFDAKAYSCDVATLGTLPLPAIALWKASHYVVIESLSDRHISIIDPAAGRGRISSNDFVNSFSGVVLTVQPRTEGRMRLPAELISSRRAAGSRARETIELFRPVRQSIALPVLLSLLYVSGSILAASYIGVLFTADNIDLSRLIIACCYIYAFNAIHAMLRNVATKTIERNPFIVPEGSVIIQLAMMPLSRLALHSKATLVAWLRSIRQFPPLISRSVFRVVQDLVSVVAFTAIAFHVSRVLGATVTVLQFIQVGTGSLPTVFSEKGGTSDAEDPLDPYELFHDMEALKVYGLGKELLDRWYQCLIKEQRPFNRTFLGMLIPEIAPLLLTTVSSLVVSLVVAHEYVSGHISDRYIFIAMVAGLGGVAPIRRVLIASRRVATAITRFHQIRDAVRVEPCHAIPDPNVPHATIKGSIEIKALSFRYEEHSTLVLQDVSFSVDKGETVAIIGRSGAGKSTLAKLLLGLHCPTSGEINIDGIPVRTIPVHDISKSLALVSGTPCIIKGTLKDNIVFARAHITEEDVLEASRLVGLDRLVATLPMGYNTRIDASVPLFSGGEYQRIALARAVAGKPRIIVLDEVMSQLNTESERLIFTNLKQLSCTQIILSVRHKSALYAERVIELKDSKVSEYDPNKPGHAEHKHTSHLRSSRRDRHDSAFASGLTRNERRCHSGEAFPPE